MKTVLEVKQACNPDLYVDMVRRIQAERQKPPVKSQPRKKSNKWEKIFPLCKM